MEKGKKPPLMVAIKQSYIYDIRKAVANFKNTVKGLLNSLEELPAESPENIEQLEKAREMQATWQEFYDRCVELEKKLSAAEYELSLGVTTTFAYILQSFLGLIAGEDTDSTMSSQIEHEYPWMQQLLEQLHASDPANAHKPN